MTSKKGKDTASSKGVKRERYEDTILPFMIESSSLRGRAVRLGPALHAILTRHEYPDAVSRLLGELLVLTSILGRMLKFEGVFSMQLKGEGPVPFMVADANDEGMIRGYASFDAEDPVFKAGNDSPPSFWDLVGKGYLAINVDQGVERSRYQGIVELEGESLSDCVVEYFRQSEQISVALKAEVGHTREDGKATDGWSAGAIMVQCLPGEEKKQDDNVVFLDFASDSSTQYGGEDWNRATIFLRSVKRSELLDPNLALKDLIYRLYHEDGVWVYETESVHEGCRCSRQRVEEIISSLGREAIMSSLEDNKISVTCEFCNTTEEFTEEELDSLFES